MTFGLNLVTGPTVEPVSLATAKLHLRVDFPDDDDLISVLITAAREYVENTTDRVYLAQTYLYTLDAFPSPALGSYTSSPSARDNVLSWGGYLQGVSLVLPLPQVKTIDAITYVDGSGTKQTLDPSLYTVDFNSEPARIMPANGISWPYPENYATGTVQITFTAGAYTPATCPASIKQAMLLLIGAWYGQRSAISDKPMTTVPMAVDCLLAPYKFYWVS